MGRRNPRGRERSAPQPPRSSTLRRVGLGLLCAHVALVPIVFDLGADATFPLPKALLAHAIGYVLVGVLVAIALTDGPAAWTRSWVHVPVFGFLGANVIATVFAPDIFSALFGAHRRMLGLGTVADYVVVYLAAAVLMRSRTQAMAICVSAIAGSVLILGYECVQFVGKDPVSDWNVSSASRPFSTLGQTTTLAEYLTVLLVAAVSVAMIEPAIRRVFRIGLALYATALLAGVLVTQTRSALIGVIAGAAMLVTLTWFGHPNPRARLFAVGGAVASAVLVIAMLAFTPLGARVLSTLDEAGVDASGSDTGPRLEESANVRLGIYRIVSEMVADRPLFGFGPDNLAVALPVYRSEKEPAEVQQSLATSAHGWLTQAAATSGIVGLLFFVVIPIVCAIATIKRGFLPSAWTALAAQAAFLGAGLTTVSDVGVDWVFWLTAGCVAAFTGTRTVLGETVTTRRGRMPARSASRPTLAIAASLVVAGAVALNGAVAYVASRSAKESQQQRVVGKAQPAVDAGLRATSWDSRRPEYWDALGLAYISAGRLNDAVSSFRRAANLAPYNVAYLGDLASAYILAIQKGDTSVSGAARAVGEQAIQADPNNPQASFTRALVMQATGDVKEALRSAERAVALDPSNNPQFLLTTTRLYIANGRPQDAIAFARPVVSLLGQLASSVPIRIELARALAMTGQTAQALTEIDAALAIRPNDPTALQLRVQIQQGQVQ